MSWIWTDRLVEVWAPPGLSGAGVLVGQRSVLTARHVVERCAAEAAKGRLQARVVRPNEAPGEWVPMLLSWSDPDWDLALLSVDPDDSGVGRWLTPQSRDPVIVALSPQAVGDCEAVGFPQAAVREQMIRQTEQVVGTLLPSGQGKIHASEPCSQPRRWMPFDIYTEPVGRVSDWSGMSGAGVVLPDGRLAGIVVVAAGDRRSGRLYVVPLGEALGRCTELTSAWSLAVGCPPVVEVVNAPQWRSALIDVCLAPQGTPLPLCDVPNLKIFGVKEANIPDEPTFLNYVPRADDAALREAMRQSNDGRKMLLVIGSSAAGKSRSAAEAALAEFPQRKLWRPKHRFLPSVVDLPVDGSGPSLVWLDDLEQYVCPNFVEILHKLLSAEHTVIATVRRDELDRLTASDATHRPAAEALADPRLVRRFNWKMEWTTEERARVETYVSNKELRDAVASGTPLGAWCVSGPQLLERLQNEKGNDDRPVRYALVRTVLDWFRTSIVRLPSQECIVDLMNRAYLGDPASDDDLRDALSWASESAKRAGHKSWHTLLTLSAQKDRIELNDYVLDHHPYHDEAIHHQVWQAAVEESIRTPEVFPGPFEMGGFALIHAEYDLARAAWTTLAASGRGDAMNALGVLESALQNKEEAQKWFERAASAGDVQAMYTLGKSAFDQGRLDIARQWWEKGSAAGDTDSMVGMAGLEQEPAAEQWLLKAAAAGDGMAMWNLGKFATSAEERRKWWNQAAEAGNPEGMFQRGLQCEDEGRHDEAVRWWKEAAESGNSWALNQLGTLWMEERPAEARQMFEEAAETGNGMAMLNLGKLLFESDRRNSAKWLVRALATDKQSTALEILKSNRDYLYGADAESGDADAMNSLAFLCLPEDPATSRLWLERASAAGNLTAMTNLAAMLAESEPEAARELWEQAAKGGNANAMAALAEYLESKDPAQARYWQSQAELSSANEE
jgi:TPR repeat protein